MKVAFIVTPTGLRKLSNINHDIIFSFKKINIPLNVPYCEFLNKKITFYNIKNGKQKLNDLQLSTIQENYEHYFYQFASWYIDYKYGYSLSILNSTDFKKRELTLLFLKILKTYRYFYGFYSAFFFLYFSYNLKYKVDFYQKLKVKIFKEIFIELPLWQVLFIHAVIYCITRDIIKDFYEENPTSKMLINNLIGYLMTSRAIYKGADWVKNYLKNIKII